ncbi:UNVERIFIED_CONTAM: hypothetical protein FKN15_024893 [Acipenser sinensis]
MPLDYSPRSYFREILSSLRIMLPLLQGKPFSLAASCDIKWRAATRSENAPIVLDHGYVCDTSSSSMCSTKLNFRSLYAIVILERSVLTLLACSQCCRRGAAVIQQPPVSHGHDTGRSAFLDALDVREVLVGSENQQEEETT